MTCTGSPSSPEEETYETINCCLANCFDAKTVESFTMS